MKSIYVGNLDFGTTEDELRALFEVHGQIERITLVRDRDTGQPRGFGFVELVNDDDADKAIQAINGAELRGRALKVSEARPKREHAGGNRGGGRGGHGGRGGSDRY